MNIDSIFDPNKTLGERRQAAREWLRTWQRERLPIMRTETISPSRFRDQVTLVAYTFPKDEADFDFIEFAIRQSWHCLGKLKAEIVADRMTPTLRCFAEACPEDIDVQVEPALVPGSVDSMSHDCVTKLHARFSTPYCLIVQDDGFPLRGNLDEFLGQYDYIGAPLVRDVPAQYLVDLFRFETLNGGFSLRSHRICRDAANQWNRYWRHLIGTDSRWHIEDVFYGATACLNPFYRLRNRFASCKVARRFCLPDFDGVLDIRRYEPRPFGVHGLTAAVQLLSGGDAEVSPEKGDAHA